MSNPRIAKLEDQIRKIVAQMLDRRVKDPRLGYVTITDVRLTGDGREATIFYTDLGRSLDGREADAPEGKVDTPAALEAAKGLLRTTVGQRLGLKFTPSLTFVQDATAESAQDMEDLLARVQASDADLANRRATASYAGDPDPYRKREDDAADDDADDDADDAPASQD
ncbi:30S ribosome-binding factor RbfA [Brooklawnia cerclae]|uniref:Ribosome-binding factor A n=1 Tax=Brooklawnia cerclae TaxID=349934 RepID=A0ABX0SHG6_9ACTN|nr:30S ribosome-binding factor RbfA [Brooklawnia cerclae]NIH57415.1 ribosome-binding factor A [Brooklawnia cerclae]